MFHSQLVNGTTIQYKNIGDSAYSITHQDIGKTLRLSQNATVTVGVLNVVDGSMFALENAASYVITLAGSDGISIEGGTATIPASSSTSFVKTSNTSWKVLSSGSGDGSTYNIKTYGGTGNGVANDDTALSTTLAKISAGGNLILPGGSWTVSNFSMPANTTIRADINTVFTTAVNITWTDIGVEYGVIYPYYPIGDVRRYGVFPDGITNWETTYGSRMVSVYTNACNPNITCYFPPGLYATGMNLNSAYSGLKFQMAPGAEFTSIVHFISTSVTRTKPINTIARASNVVSITTAGSHGFSVGETIRVTGVQGGTTDFNGEEYVIASVPTSSSLTFTQVGADESGSINGAEAYMADKALRNVQVKGKIVTYDRFGTINIIDSHFDGVIIKNDPSKHLLYPGTKARGVHLYTLTENCSFGDILIEDCGTTSNTDAAFAMDGGVVAPRRCKFGKVHIKASDVHGAYICGFSNTFDELRVDEFSLSQNANVLQDTDGLAQSQEGKGVWFNRCNGTTIGTLRVNQSTVGTRSNAYYHVLFDETSHGSITDVRSRGIHIDKCIIRNVQAQGVSFGDRNYPAPTELHVHINYAEIQLGTGKTMTTNYQMLHINKQSADTRVWIGKLDFVDGVSQLRMRTASGTVFNFNCITDRGYTSLTNNGQLLEAQGTIIGHSIQYLYSGGSTLVPLIYLNGAGASDSSISDIYITSASSVNTPSLKLDTVSRVNINKFYSTNMRNSTSNVELKSITSCILSNFNMVASGNVGTGVVLNVLTDSLLANWTITGFSKGVDQFGTAAITRCTAINCNISGNTTQTDVLANSFTVLNASSIQL